MTYPTPLNDLLSLAALFGIPVFLGLLISIIMFRRGTCWLALLSGVAIQIYLNYVEVQYFQFWGFSEVCAKIVALTILYVSISTAVLALIRIIFRVVKHNKDQAADEQSTEDSSDSGCKANPDSRISEESQAPVVKEVVPPAKMDGKNWICPKCGKKNNPILIRCPKCNTIKVLPGDVPAENQKPAPIQKTTPQPVQQGSQQILHLSPNQVRELEQKLTELTTRWVCPNCGLVHSKELQVCFHCGTPQTSANKFIQ